MAIDPFTITNAEQAEALVRERGLRLSHARRRLIRALLRAPGPVGAETIAAGLDGRVAVADLGSVYRNLEALESIGLVRRLDLGGGPALYALANRMAPAYLVCESCGVQRGLAAADLAPLRESISRRTGFEASFARFPIVGVCEACAAASGELS